MVKVKSILIVGVGGQGTLLASKILTQGLMETGYDVKMSEIHGMSQRGGSVSAHIRYGERVYSPVISEGEADILLSFEEMEAYRWLNYLKPGGKAIINNYRLPSAPILTGQTDYPEGLIEEMAKNVDVIMVNAMDIALGLSFAKSMNIVLLGALIKIAELNNINWENIIRRIVPEKYLEGNLRAFEAGMNSVS
ncbi:MAG TPA: indolepyruvate oxidoreductase subunit beta [Clostridiaceae bacterium]|jgi:indolepyruvate ferredoxin oxidoreductase beta subunit|nr:indolepyruvate oxidoreductase subunit beta [Clostridiaceae bacterium]